MFAASVSGLDESGREQVIETELTQGNIPGFLRKLKPVQLTRKFDDGKTVDAIFQQADVRCASD